ncbi:aryl hydrocarbon receptor repressor [Rhinoderma darwinii]|uniref:aryl hydrocarbon receptor repressor n=1 Tax=Rhinoderma darwinii TaxID=43563 RepID=UPI003F66FB7A
MYAGRKRRKPIQKQRPSSGSEKSNPSKRHRDRLNAELDRLASLLPFPPEIITKLDKLSILRLSVSYLRVKSFFQAVQHHQKHGVEIHPLTSVRTEVLPCNLQGELLLESLNGFALVVSTEGMIFYVSSTILDYLGFHQTDVMHQNVYDYIHVDDRQEFCRQLHWAMNPQQIMLAQESQTETGEEVFLKKLYKAQESNSSNSEYSTFLNRCFICRVRCLLDSTSGFLTMQFEGKLKFLFGQKKKASPGSSVSPQMALFCIAVPLLLPPITEMKMKSVLVKTQKKPGAPSNTENIEKAFPSIEVENNGRNDHQGACFSNMLHNTENQIKLMNAGDSGVSLVKVRTNEDQWVWVEANAPILYRNGCSDYAVVPQQAQRDEEAQIKKQTMLGMKGREVPLCNSSSESPALLKQHLPWGKHEMEDMNIKYHTTKTDSFLQEENYLPKHFPSMQNHCNTSSGWTVKNPVGSRSGHQLINSLSSRSGRPFYNIDQSHPGVHMASRPHRGVFGNFQAYHGLQQHSVDSYSTDNIKMENAFVTPDVLYDSGLPLNIPIKTENDSDSDSRNEPYPKLHGHDWVSEINIPKRSLMDFPEGLHLKTELGLSEQNVCLKPKHHVHSTHRGHCFVPAAHMNHINTSRPFKGLYNKDPAQFYPQKCNYLDGILNQQGADCNSSLYATDDKNQGDQSYKLQCQFKAHNIVQNIKREPLDSPPWVESDQESVPALYQKNTLMGFLSGQMPHNVAEFAYIQ